MMVLEPRTLCVILEEHIYGMMDDPKFPISEMHLGKFPDSLEFQSWEVNFKTEVSAKSAFPHITMHWIKEVEIAK